MIYVCYGSKKSGSTLAYNLTRILLEAAGHEHISLPPEFLGEQRKQAGYANNIRFWTPELVAAAEVFVPAGRIVPFRTHVGPTTSIADCLAQGRGRLQVTIRDPRDLALSFMDVAERQSLIGFERWDNFLIDRGSFDVVVHKVAQNIGFMTAWADLADAMILKYEETAFTPHVTIRRICEQLQLDLPEEAFDGYFRTASENPNVKRNVAQPARHRREMPAEQQEEILSRFAPFYARFFPDARVDVEESDSDRDIAGERRMRAAEYMERRQQKNPMLEATGTEQTSQDNPAWMLTREQKDRRRTKAELRLEKTRNLDLHSDIPADELTQRVAMARLLAQDALNAMPQTDNTQQEDADPERNARSAAKAERLRAREAARQRR